MKAHTVPQPDQVGLLTELSTYSLAEVNTMLRDAELTFKGPKANKAEKLVRDVPFEKLRSLMQNCRVMGDQSDATAGEAGKKRKGKSKDAPASAADSVA